MKRVLIGGVLFVLAGVAMGANLVWDITPLDPTIFGGNYTESKGWSINNHKQIIGEVWTAVNGIQTDLAPAVWDFSEPNGWGASHTMVTRIESMHLQSPILYQINDSGQVCGMYTYAYPGEERQWAFFRRPMVYDIYSRTVRDLGSLGDDEDDIPFLDDYRNCYESFSLAINNAGTIVGKSIDGKTNIYGLRQIYGGGTVVWEGGARPVLIGEPNDYLCGINNNNIMIGSEQRDLGLGSDKAFIQTGQNKTMLPLLDGCADWISSAKDINDQNMVVGTISAATSVGILWHPTEGIVQLPNYPGYDWAIPRAINNQGTIVGESNGAVVWIGTGNNYQVVDMRMFAAQTGWALEYANDINDEGWIVGWGTFEGRQLGFLARPRLDENSPLANLDSDYLKNENGKITISVFYYDDNGMNTAMMDNDDIQVVYPDGTRVAAEFLYVNELDPEPETGKRKYQTRYRFSSLPMNPMRAAEITCRVEVAESEISDLSGRYVAKGLIGEIEVTLPDSTVTIVKGAVFDEQTSTTAWTFETHLYTVPVNPILQILGVQFQAPGSSVWRTMTSAGGGIWSYSQTASSAGGLNDFGDGEYTYRMSLDFGGPLDIEMVFTYGEDSDGDPIAAPASRPEITSPLKGQTVSHKQIPLSWQPTSDVAVTSIICSVVDVADGVEVFSRNFPDGSADSAGTITLSPDRTYEMTVYFCAGDQHFSEEEIDWTSYKLKYTATRLRFSTQDYLGDINADGSVNMLDLSLLSACWQKMPSQAGWNVLCDLQTNGKIDIGDLALMAENWLQ